MADPDFFAMLRALRGSGVECIVVGVLAACLQGAPLVALELAIVPSRTEGNLMRLLAALRALGGSAETSATREELAAADALRLETPKGTLVVRAEIGGGLDYDELERLAFELDVAEGLRIRVVRLESLVELARGDADEEARAILPMLTRTLEESRRASA